MGADTSDTVYAEGSAEHALFKALDLVRGTGTQKRAVNIIQTPGSSTARTQQQILRKDLDAIVGVVLVIAAMFLVTNVIVDLIVSIINPRIRLAERRAKS